eukprot:TRINITY_DN13637_c0_g1_i3.p1 TRINITY_DN13637_c0_g1~~TRINITY_DN13637_c0_g1_i3.p1  ORF type:complete len:860 (+),score=115.33 TRINITY_DN13637_c0_g1_i3:130-2580(+)
MRESNHLVYYKRLYTSCPGEQFKNEFWDKVSLISVVAVDLEGEKNNVTQEDLIRQLEEEENSDLTLKTSTNDNANLAKSRTLLTQEDPVNKINVVADNNVRNQFNQEGKRRPSMSADSARNLNSNSQSHRSVFEIRGRNVNYDSCFQNHSLGKQGYNLDGVQQQQNTCDLGKDFAKLSQQENLQFESKDDDEFERLLQSLSRLKSTDSQSYPKQHVYDLSCVQCNSFNSDSSDSSSCDRNKVQNISFDQERTPRPTEGCSKFIMQNTDNYDRSENGQSDRESESSFQQLQLRLSPPQNVNFELDTNCAYLGKSSAARRLQAMHGEFIQGKWVYWSDDDGCSQIGHIGSRGFDVDEDDAWTEEDQEAKYCVYCQEAFNPASEALELCKACTKYYKFEFAWLKAFQSDEICPEERYDFKPVLGEAPWTNDSQISEINSLVIRNRDLSTFMNYVSLRIRPGFQSRLKEPQIQKQYERVLFVVVQGIITSNVEMFKGEGSRYFQKWIKRFNLNVARKVSQNQIVNGWKINIGCLWSGVFEPVSIDYWKEHPLSHQIGEELRNTQRRQSFRKDIGKYIKKQCRHIQNGIYDYKDLCFMEAKKQTTVKGSSCSFFPLLKLPEAPPVKLVFERMMRKNYLDFVNCRAASTYLRRLCDEISCGEVTSPVDACKSAFDLNENVPLFFCYEAADQLMYNWYQSALYLPLSLSQIPFEQQFVYRQAQGFHSDWGEDICWQIASALEREMPEVFEFDRGTFGMPSDDDVNDFSSSGWESSTNNDEDWEPEDFAVAEALSDDLYFNGHDELEDDEYEDLLDMMEHLGYD